MKAYFDCLAGITFWLFAQTTLNVAPFRVTSLELRRPL
jgi:hypothetical protein